jgi:hypothetical protein
MRYEIRCICGFSFTFETDIKIVGKYATYTCGACGSKLQLGGNHEKRKKGHKNEKDGDYVSKKNKTQSERK